MLKALVEFVDGILPAVPLDKKEGLLAAIEQFKMEGKGINYLSLTPLECLSQGDIVSSIPFSIFDKDGKEKRFTTEAIVISTSCHIDNKDKLILAPVFPLDAFQGNQYELKMNKVFDYMYIPDTRMENKFISFEILNTYSKELIITGLNKGKIKRLFSLNQIGYYLFIIKLTVYLMRREDSDTLKERNDMAYV